MSPATKSEPKAKAPAKATSTPRKRTTGRGPKPVEGAVKETGPAKPGVDKATADETAKATKRTVAKGRRSSEVVTVTVPKGAPTNRDEWDAMVLTAKSEHEAYLKWRRDGQPGGVKAQPKQPMLEALKALKDGGVTRASLPEGPSATVKRTKATGARRTGSIPEGKTAAGLDRMDDTATVAWIRKTDPKGESTIGALHKAFRAAGYGANAKRFARLVESARAAKGK